MAGKTSTQKAGWWSLSPLMVFLCLYLLTSILMNDFYKVPITVAFLVSSCYAIITTRGLKPDERINLFSSGAGNKNILLMVWIFVLAGAFAQGAEQIGAIDAAVNLTLNILPGNLLLAGILLGSAYIYTRNLWFAIALHWFWNWLQGPVLGFEVSGNAFGESLLTLDTSAGSALLNGGPFGFEGSLICTVLMLAAIWLIIRYYNRGMVRD